MRGSKAKRLRHPEMRPHPGRKHGGVMTAVRSVPQERTIGPFDHAKERRSKSRYLSPAIEERMDRFRAKRARRKTEKS